MKFCFFFISMSYSNGQVLESSDGKKTTHDKQMNYSEMFFEAKKSGDWSDIKKDLLDCENINETFMPGGWRLRMLIHFEAPDELVKLAIMQGADVNSKDGGYTIFMSRAHKELKYYKLIGENGYDISYIDKYGKNILHYSVTLKHWETALAKYVLEKCKEADLEYLLNEKEERGLTPLHVALTYPLYETSKLFIENGADPYVEIEKDIPGNTDGNILYLQGSNAFDMIKRLKEKYQKESKLGYPVTDKLEEIKKLENYFSSLKK